MITEQKNYHHNDLPFYMFNEHSFVHVLDLLFLAIFSFAAACQVQQACQCPCSAFPDLTCLACSFGSVCETLKSYYMRLPVASTLEVFQNCAPQAKRMYDFDKLNIMESVQYIQVCHICNVHANASRSQMCLYSLYHLLSPVIKFGFRHPEKKETIEIEFVLVSTNMGLDSSVPIKSITRSVLQKYSELYSRNTQNFISSEIAD